jgi:hypothetical protein
MKDKIGIAFKDDNTVVVFNRFDVTSRNEKTGAMIQSWILVNSDTAPHKLAKSGADINCGTCPLKSGNGCYVLTHQAPRAIWQAFNRGRYAIVGEDISENEAYSMLAGKAVRIGSYGNPSFGGHLVDWSRIAVGAKTHTGYDHEWRTADLQTSIMASVHSAEERTEAKARGYRTFRTIDSVEDLGDNEILCPASAEAGRKTTCEKCGLCSGTSTNSKKDIAIVGHGSGAKKVREVTRKHIGIPVSAIKRAA